MAVGRKPNPTTLSTAGDRMPHSGQAAFSARLSQRDPQAYVTKMRAGGAGDIAGNANERKAGSPAFDVREPRKHLRQQGFDSIDKDRPARALSLVGPQREATPGPVTTTSANRKILHDTGALRQRRALAALRTLGQISSGVRARCRRYLDRQNVQYHWSK